jgi:hypothetical protein
MSVELNGAGGGVGGVSKIFREPPSIGTGKRNHCWAISIYPSP